MLREAFGVSILLIILITIPSVVAADGPPHNFEIEPASFWGGTSGIAQVGTIFQDTGTIKWSFESSVPLDLDITDPEGYQIDAVYNQYATEGTFSVDRVGTYIFKFTNKYDETAQVSLNYYYTSPLNEDQSIGLAIVGIILLIIVTVIVIIIYVMKQDKHPKQPMISQSDQRQRIREPIPGGLQEARQQAAQQQQPIHQTVHQPTPKPQQAPTPINMAVQPLICPICGAKNAATSKFCNECGKPF